MSRSYGMLVCMVAWSVATGCGRHVGQIRGSVSVDGTPLRAGTVCVLAGRNTVIRAPIQEDATFAAAAVPVGEVRLAIHGGIQLPEARTGGGAFSHGAQFDPTEPGSTTLPTSLPRATTIPLIYQDFSTTPLVRRIDSGLQQWNLDVTTSDPPSKAGSP